MDNFVWIFSVYVARNYETKQSRGFAFVTYENGKDCEEACKALDGKVTSRYSILGHSSVSGLL